jgi:oxygen-independent coproporphyrinogen-3 oxidase
VNYTAGIYIHIPFCARKCTYCNFNTTDFHEQLTAGYARAVAGEISYWGRKLATHPADTGALPVDTIYFGGGTPSIVDPEQIAALIRVCRAEFSVSAGAEITIEINPGAFLREKVERWLSAGVNRASVGVQSFIDRELIQLSRTHLADDALRTVDQLRESGFSNISLDLIAGLPGQTVAGWRFNLKQALGVRPEHLSLYLLEVKEGTRLFGEIKRGMQPRPDDDVAAEMYRTIREEADAAGYDHYEISNFALGKNSSAYRSKHNMKYWTDAPFYGMGCGAHSYDGRFRWFNILKTESYVESVNARGSAVAERRILSEKERAADALFMGLRLLEGVDLEAFASQYAIDVLDSYGDELRRVLEAGLVEVANGRLRLTPAGLPLSNEVFMAFV